jgi:hypothetical protein
MSGGFLVTRALFVLGCCSLAAAQSPSTDWRFAQPDADIKISVNLQALLKSDAISKAIEQGKAQAKDKAGQIDFVIAMLRTIDRVSVAAHQKGPNDMDVLAEVTGSFDPQMIAGFFPSTGKSQVKVVGPHTILIGEGDSFLHAIGRMSGSDASGPGDELEQSDIWIGGNVALLAQQSGQPMPPMLQSLRTFSMGLTLSAAPELNLVLSAADDAGAGQILMTVQMMAGPLLMATPEVAAAGKAISFKQDGSKVRMHFVVPPELLAMAQQQALSASGGGFPSQFAPILGSFGIGGASAPAAPTKPPTRTPMPGSAPAPQNGGKILIYGLDDGPKEIAAPK